jgi:hypothetical protein
MDVHWLLVAGSVLDKQAELTVTKIRKSTFQKFLETPDEKLLTDDEALANSINLSYEAEDRSFAAVCSYSALDLRVLAFRS